MSQSPQPHLSRWQIDRCLWRAADGVSPELEHVERCEACEARLRRMERDYQVFLEQYPLDRLRARRADRPAPIASDAGAAADPTRREPARRWLRPALVAFAAAAAAALLLVVVPRPVFDHAPPSSSSSYGPSGSEAAAAAERAKGGSTMELAVQRDGESFRYDGQPLYADDVLAFRYSTPHRYLLVVSIEQSGSINVLLADGQRARSLPIRPGRRITLEQGIALDGYVGAERLIALLSPHPLDVGRVRRAVVRALERHGKDQLSSMRIETLGGAVEQLAWTLRKEQR